MSGKASMSERPEQVDFSDEASIEAYAQRLEGMTFQDVLALGIYSPRARAKEERLAAKGEKDEYGRIGYKGGVGNLIEERYFGYDANSDERPDFPAAGVELKTTCFDMKKGGVPSAGERLSITMIPFDRPVDMEFESSHLWEKSHRILLVFYRRDRKVGKYDQVIKYVTLFTPPEKDLAIIREDFETIIKLVREGRADELSEGLTTYLGAATKGASESKMWVEQYYPRLTVEGTGERRLAKRRVFSFKRQYMDYVLNNYVIPGRAKARRHAKLAMSRGTAELDSGVTSILDKPLGPGETFAGRIEQTVARYIGHTDEDLRKSFGIKLNKSTWVTIARRILGITGNHVEEFRKANISLRVIRVEANGHIKESLSFAPFEFEDLLAEPSWYDSNLFACLDEMKFCFVIFRRKKVGGPFYLDSVRLWNMPEADIEHSARACWERTRAVVREGVALLPRIGKSGKVTYANNLPAQADNEAVHVRPHANRAAYRFADGAEVGNIKRDASRLPDGRWMTKQSFWLNSGYLKAQLLG